MKSFASRCAGLLPVLPFALASWACGSDVSIGVSTSNAYMDAARLAIEDAQAASRGLRVDTVMIPEQSNRATPAIAAAEKFLRRRDLIAVIGHSNSSATLATAGIYNQREVVQLTPTASAAMYSEAGPYSFRLIPSDDRQGVFLAERLAEAFPAGSRIALFFVSDDYGRGLRDGIRDALTAAGTKVVLEMPYAEELIRLDDTEHARDAVAAHSPDAIIWLGRSSALDLYLPGLRVAAPDALILGSDAVGRPRPNVDGRWSGVQYVDFLDLQSTEALRDFAARYEARFGRRATTPDALTYDAVRLILAAIGDGARSGPALREYLASLGRTRPAYRGITGPLEFDERGDVGRTYTLSVMP